jgi:outer membrane protein assembly factor BamB
MKFLYLLSALLLIQDWPEFRGPSGQGISDQTGLPLTWSESKNVLWKTEIPGKGWSSPVIHEDRVWLTTSTEEGKSLRAICVDRNTGAILKNIEVFRLNSIGRINPRNNPASPTPVLEGDRIYLHFGAFGTACISQSGEILWKARLEYDNGQHGPGSSPVLYDDLLIVNCDGMKNQYVAALDKLTGKIRWKQSRQGSQAYTTPLIVRLSGGDQVISLGAYRVISYEPRTGKEIWQVNYGKGLSNVPSPVFGNGLVFICTGFTAPSLIAIRVDGSGDVTNSHVVWTREKGVPLASSPILAGEELYMISDLGTATCLDARTGKEKWQRRVGGRHWASAIFADHRIYFLSEDGESVVIEPGKEFKILATNRLDGRTLASMAVSNGSIFIRSETHLYCLREK